MDAVFGVQKIKTGAKSEIRDAEGGGHYNGKFYKWEGNSNMKKFISILIILLILSCVYGCTRFQFPRGVWRCEELKITMDFSKRADNGAIKGMGEIEVDGEIVPIICMMSPIGEIYIWYEREDNNYGDDEIYGGELYNKGEDKMLFKYNGGNQAEFVKVVE